MKISVCMATYNGDKYVQRQIDSILKQLNAGDELVIIDDCSSDKTIELIQLYADARIKLIKNECNMGVVKSFERAVQNTSGDIIFLADQDDEWADDKVSVIVDNFVEYRVDLIQHDAIIVDATGKIIHGSWSDLRNFGAGIVKNFVKNTYTGCCMAFTKKLKEKALPIPIGVESHDQWLGTIAELHGFQVRFIPHKLLRYSRHGMNVSNMERRDMSDVLLGRVKFLYALTTHVVRTIL